MIDERPDEVTAAVTAALGDVGRRLDWQNLTPAWQTMVVTRLDFKRGCRAGVRFCGSSSNDLSLLRRVNGSAVAPAEGETMIERANCVIALRSEGVSVGTRCLRRAAARHPALGCRPGNARRSRCCGADHFQHRPRRPERRRRAGTSRTVARTLDGLGGSSGPERIARRPSLVAQVHRDGGPARRGARRRDRWFTNLDQFGRSCR